MNDAKNRFAKNDAARQARREEASRTAVAEHQTRLAENRAMWHGSRRTDNRVGGTLLDDATLKAKRDRDDDLAAGRSATSTPPPLSLSAATMEAVTVSWLQLTPDFYNSDFNRTSMRNWVRMNIERNGAVFGIELLDTAFRWLSENNHLEKAPSTVRKRGEVVSAAAPEIFPYDAPEEISARTELARQVAQSIEDVETERAKSLPFETLEQEVRSGYKVRTRQQADGVVGAIR